MNRSSILLTGLMAFVLLQAPCAAQDSLLLQRQQLRFNKPYFSRQGISLDGYAYDNAAINAQLLEIPRNDQKAQNKLVGAGLLAVLGIGLMTLSTGESKPKPPSNSVVPLSFNVDLGKPLLFTLGLASTVVAIPLGVSSVKYRKQRNKALADVKAYFLFTN